MTTSWRLHLWVEGVDLNNTDPSTDMAVVDDTDLDADLIAWPLLLSGLAHELTIGDALWPAQHSETLTFGILAETAAELAGLENGNRVAAGWRTPGGPFSIPADESDASPWTWLFQGQVTSAEMRTHSRGVLVQVTATGYVHSELAEEHAAGTDWPQENISDRVDALLDFEDYGPGLPHSDPQVAAREGNRVTKLSLLEQYLAEWVQPFGTALGRLVIDPVGRAPLSEPAPYHQVDQRVRHGWSLTIRWRDSAFLPPGATLHADRFSFSAGWSNRRDLNATRIAVTGPTGVDGKEQTQVVTNDDDDDGHRVTRSIATDLVSEAKVALVGELYIPVAGLSPWHADTFTWLYYAETDGTQLPRIGGLVNVEGLQARHNPGAGTTYTGQLARRRFTLGGYAGKGGRPVVELDLRPAPPSSTPVVDGGPSDAVHLDVIDGGPSDADHDLLLDGGTSDDH